MQALMVKELFGLARRIDESLSLPLFRTQQWYFFFVATFYLYGRCAPKVPLSMSRSHECNITTIPSSTCS